MAEPGEARPFSIARDTCLQRDGTELLWRTAGRTHEEPLTDKARLVAEAGRGSYSGFCRGAVVNAAIVRGSMMRSSE